MTASDNSHFASSIQLLNSVKFFEPSMNVLYFDLGISEELLAILARDFPKVRVVQFDYGSYPDFFNINVEAGQYAWKPAAITVAAGLTHENLLWLDAGDLLISNLTLVKRLIARDGIFIMQTSNTVGELTHPATLQYFQADALLSRLQLSAAIIGFSRNSSSAMSALSEWQKLCESRQIIAPRFSSRKNHRQDQAVLTLILFQTYDLDRKIRRFLRWKIANTKLGLLTHQDIEEPFHYK